MSTRIHVATRKGLFTLHRSADRWEIERASFVGDPVTMMLDDPRDGTLYAALNLGHFGVKLHRSADGGGSWEEVAAPAFPAPSQDKLDATPTGPSVHQVWELVAAGDDQPGALWAGTIPGALFRSADRGASWKLNEPLWQRPEREKWFGGGFDDPGVHSIVVDPRDSRRLLVGVSCGGVWETTDAGASWAVRCEGMFAAYMPPERKHDPDIQDPHRLVACPADPDHLWVQHHNGVFRSTDGARSWSEVPGAAPSNFGFAVVVHPDDPGTAWFAPAVKDECRVPVDGKVVVSRTRDGGATFEVLDRGLPDRHAYDLVFRHALAVDREGETLAMGSTTGNLWLGEEGGERWTVLSTHLPPIYQVVFAAR